MNDDDRRMMNSIASAIDELGSDCNMRRDRSYTGRPHQMDGLRGQTEIKNITFRDLRDCYIRAVCMSDGIDHPVHYQEAQKGEHAVLCENDVYEMSTDPIAVLQNLMCEIEKLMNIYPNI